MEFAPCSTDIQLAQTDACLIPALSIGNVGQLSVDLLAFRHSDYLKRVGALYHPLVQAVCGQNALSNDINAPMALALEVYQSIDAKFTVLQFRSRMVEEGAGAVQEFWRDLEQWMITSLKVKECLIVTGVDATRCFDSQLSDTTHRCRSIGFIDGVPELEASWPKREGTQITLLPGAGALPIFALESKLLSSAVKVLILFTVDGNNLPDAEFVVQVLKQWMHQSSKKALEMPPSWSSMYGVCSSAVELYQ